MVDEPHNLLLDHLRDIRGALARLERDVSDMKLRLGRVETQSATSLGQLQMTLAEHSVRFDRLDERFDRIERRLNLVEPI